MCSHQLHFAATRSYHIASLDLTRSWLVAYKLGLPEQSKIHMVVHVSQLKQHIPPMTQVSTDLSSVITDETIPILPVAVLESKLVAQAGTVQNLVKIQCSGMSPTLATWEDAADLRRCFPSALAWGQAGSKGGGNVRIPQV